MNIESRPIDFTVRIGENEYGCSNEEWKCKLCKRWSNSVEWKIYITSESSKYTCPKCNSEHNFINTDT